MADLTDVLTTAQNIAQFLSTIGAEISVFHPDFTSKQMVGNTLVQSGFVRVLGISVTTAGAAGALHDAATITAAASTNVIYEVAATKGYFPFSPSIIVTDGLVYKPGAGQVATLFYVRS
jgi:hypothetical protein